MKTDLSISERTGAMPNAPASSEARWRALLEAAVDGVLSIDECGTIQTNNPAAERLFGYAADEMIGRNVKVLMPSPYQDEHDGYLARYLATGEKRIIGIGREALGRRKDGTTFPMDLSVAEAWLGSERIFVGIIRDISERKGAEAALRESKHYLETAVAELQTKNEEIRAMSQQLWQAAKLASVGELAAGIAHELNNPLATVTLRVEAVLGRTPVDDPRRKPLQVIEQEIKRMAELVANLLQFSRRSEGQVSTLDIRQELGRAVELISHQFRNRRITVGQEFAANTPTLYADRQKLRQVFLNLLSNASDAMPTGGELTLRTAADTLSTDIPAVSIEFADTGSGIPAEHLDRIMEPFFTTKEEDKGTGLGLAICRRVINEHGGAIQVASEVGRGTTVRLLLPVTPATNVDQLRRFTTPKQSQEGAQKEVEGKWPQ